MRNWLFISCFGLLLISCSSTAQNGDQKKISYAIDKTLAEKSNIKKVNSLFSAAMDVKWMENGKEADILLVNGKGVPYYAVTIDKNDTILVTLMPIFAPGHGVIMMNFVKDTVIAFQLEAPRHEEPVLKNSSTDTAYKTSLEIQPIVCRIIVKTKPVAGSAVEGYIEFEGEDYYLGHAGIQDTKYSYKAKGYFKAIHLGQ